MKNNALWTDKRPLSLSTAPTSSSRNACSESFIKAAVPALRPLASNADVLRGSSRVPAPTNVRGTGTRDEPLRTSAGEAIRPWDLGAEPPRKKKKIVEHPGL